MKRFRCACGQPAFFDNDRCIACGLRLGYSPEHATMLSFGAPGRDGDAVVAQPSGVRVRRCRNQVEHGVCNWVVAADDPSPLCLACRLNRVVPNLGKAGNLVLWRRLERAKRRLLYGLLSLGLPIEHQDGAPVLTFRFLEDRRRNADVSEPYVTTGHAAGVVTINVLEADDSERHAVREEMRESYRTLLGHFRHESGHAYWPLLVAGVPAIDEFRSLFGDERADYAAALDRNYRHGPQSSWQAQHVSAYAAVHPHEDWAESWAHYLHILDGLETARENGLLAPGPAAEWDAEMDAWSVLAVGVNELNRSLGLDDAYPFVLNRAVRMKLAFIHRRLAAGRAARAAPATPGTRPRG